MKSPCHVAATQHLPFEVLNKQERKNKRCEKFE